MGLPLSSVLLLLVPPVALFALALAHLLRAPREGEAPAEPLQRGQLGSAGASPSPDEGGHGRATPRTTEDPE